MKGPSDTRVPKRVAGWGRGGPGRGWVAAASPPPAGPIRGGKAARPPAKAPAASWVKCWQTLLWMFVHIYLFMDEFLWSTTDRLSLFILWVGYFKHTVIVTINDIYYRSWKVWKVSAKCSNLSPGATTRLLPRYCWDSRGWDTTYSFTSKPKLNIMLFCSCSHLYVTGFLNSFTFSCSVCVCLMCITCSFGACLCRVQLTPALICQPGSGPRPVSLCRIPGSGKATLPGGHFHGGRGELFTVQPVSQLTDRK